MQSTTLMTNPRILQASKLIEQRTGLAVSKQFHAELTDILVEMAAGDLPGLLDRMAATPTNSPLWQQIMYALSIGETYFFRDGAHFRLLRDTLLPALINQRRRENTLTLNIWSAGCATGEEPYSIAIALHHLLPDRSRWTINLIGTDINNRALDHAREAIYRDWSFRRTDDHFKTQHFLPVDGGWKLQPTYREMVAFRSGNLLDSPPLPHCDIIFCRNVLIYFGGQHTFTLEDTLFRTLIPGGWLLLGQSEALRGRRERWLTHIFPGAVMYQKPAEGPLEKYVRYTQPPLQDPDPVEPPPVQTLYDAALATMREEQYDEAERLLVAMLEEHPGYAPGHTLLAYIFANRQAIPEAHAQLDKALHHEAMLADAHYLRATLYLEEEREDDADRALRAALYCRRDHPLAAFVAGVRYARQDDTRRARRAWKMARQAVTDCPPEKHFSDLSDLNVTAFLSLINNLENQFSRRG